MVEEAHVSVLAEGQGEFVIAAMRTQTVTAQAAMDNVIPVVQLSDSSEEYGDSRDIDPELQRTRTAFELKEAGL